MNNYGNRKMKTGSDRFLETIGAIIVVGALGYWAYNSWVVEPAENKKKMAKQRTESSQRFKDWAYVAKEKVIAPGETIKLVVIPDSTGLFSTKCFVYTHSEFKTSSMICPDAKQDDIGEELE